MCPTVIAATSDRRSPQPRRTARIALSRRPLGVVASGVFKSVWACRTVSQFPRRTPGRTTCRVSDFRVAKSNRPTNSGAAEPLSWLTHIDPRLAVRATRQQERAQHKDTRRAAKHTSLSFCPENARRGSVTTCSGPSPGTTVLPAGRLRWWTPYCGREETSCAPLIVRLVAGFRLR
jgi:hypothetical protein